MRYRDLPPPIPDRVVPTPTGAVTVLSQQPALRCDACDSLYSADPGDYWGVDPEAPIECGECGALMRVVMTRTTYEDYPPEEGAFAMAADIRTFPPLAVSDTAGDHQYAIYDATTGRTEALVYNRDPNSRALAELLALAPELLDALRAFVTCPTYRGINTQAMRKARALINEVDHAHP